MHPQSPFEGGRGMFYRGNTQGVATTVEILNYALQQYKLNFFQRRIKEDK